MAEEVELAATMVWVVISGSYSDRRVDSVWTDREAARSAATLLCQDRYSRASVNGFPLDVGGHGEEWNGTTERFDSDSPREDKSVVGTALEHQ